MKWTEAKRAGLCTKCGARPATGNSKILCDVCRETIRQQHAQGAEPIKYYNPDGKPQTNGSRG